MFTGIIESLGTVTQVRHQGTSIIVRISHDADSFPVAIGGSVAIDGICLTLEEKTGNEMQFCAVAETLRRSTLYNVTHGRRINLERALRADGRFDGHFVYGHIDDTAVILHDREMNGSIIRTISLPEGLSPFIAEKGSIAVDGISLTISRCDSTSFDISLIPHTLRLTTMAIKKNGDMVNIECDIVARYLKNIGSIDTTSPKNRPPQETLEHLMERSGF